MIILTRADAEQVCGLSPTHPGRALEPAPLKDGTYILPDDVMDDPAHADVRDLLAANVVPGDSPDPSLVWDFGTPDEPNQEEIDAYNEAKLSWSEDGGQR